MYQAKRETPKLQQWLLNEILKQYGDICLEERLNAAYLIIKSQPKIYKKLKENNFLQSFITISQLLVNNNDKVLLHDLIDFSYIVLHDKEDVKQSYFELKREIESMHTYERKEEKQKNFTRIL
jgi:uncharacterized protein YecA (UPF0149 family)